jgi:hypothetical protein
MDLEIPTVVPLKAAQHAALCEQLLEFGWGDVRTFPVVLGVTGTVPHVLASLFRELHGRDFVPKGYFDMQRQLHKDAVYSALKILSTYRRLHMHLASLPGRVVPDPG